MIPYLVTVSRRSPEGRWRGLHVPVLPLLVVASPLLSLAVPAGLIACLATRVSPIGALRGTGRLLWALPGTRIEFEQGGTVVLVRVK